MKDSVSHLKTLIALAAALGCFCGDAQAIDLTQSVVAAGGGRTAGGAYTASTTIGQPIVGDTTGGNYAISAGFWNLPDPGASGIEPELELAIPTSFALGRIEPNPFTSSTSVHYSLPSAVSRIKIDVFDASGRRVRALIDGPQNAGYFTVTWNGLDDRGLPASSGVYFCQMVTDSFKRTTKIVATR